MVLLKVEKCIFKRGKVHNFQFVSFFGAQDERQNYLGKAMNNVYSTYECDHDAPILVRNGQDLREE